MKTIAIVIGHGPRVDRGAIGHDGTTELYWNTDLALRILDAINSGAAGDVEGHRTPAVKAVVIARRTEKQPPIDEVNGLRPAAAVELHLNAFNAKASGTEMIHYPGSTKGKDLAVLLQQAAVKVLALPDRGVKGPQAGGRGMAFLAKTSCPAVIVESFFIDNPTDLARGNAKKQALAEAYAAALLKFVQ